MNRFRSKKRGKQDVQDKLWEFETSLPSTDSFRTSLLLPKMIERFSILQMEESKADSMPEVHEVKLGEEKPEVLTGEEDFRVLGHRAGSGRLFTSTQREWRIVEPHQKTLPNRGRSMSLSKDMQQSDPEAADDISEQKGNRYKRDSPVHYSIRSSQSVNAPGLVDGDMSIPCSPNTQKSLAPSPIPDTAPLHVEKGTRLGVPKHEESAVALSSLVAEHLRESKSETESSRPTTAYLDEEMETVWDHHYHSAPTENKPLLESSFENESLEVTTLQIPDLPRPKGAEKLPVISATLPFSISQGPLRREKLDFAHARESSEEWETPDEPVTPENEPADIDYAGQFGNNSLAQSYDRLRTFEAEINDDAHWRQGHCPSTPSSTPRKIKRSSPLTASPGTLEAIPEDHVVTPNASPRRSPAQSRSSSSTVPSAEMTAAYPFPGMSTPPNRITGSRSQPSLHSHGSSHSASSSSSSPDSVREVFTPVSMASSPSTPPSKRKVDKRDIGVPVFRSTSNTTVQTRPLMPPKSQPRITSWREDLQPRTHVGVRLF